MTLTIDVYEGARKIGSVVPASDGAFSFSTSANSIGTYRFVARAIDDLGGTMDSSPRTVSVYPVGQARPVLQTYENQGELYLEVQGVPGRSFLLQTSTNLVTWTTQQTNQFSASSGLSRFHLTSVTNPAIRIRIYKAIQN